LIEKAKADRDDAEKTYNLFIQTRKSIPRDGAVDVKGARIVAESWKEFGLQKPPPPVEGAIDMKLFGKPENKDGQQ
jgi:hypothetical protein